MKFEKWLEDNATSLKGKTVAITGSTGGLGIEICNFLTKLGADLILINRSFDKTETQIKELQNSSSSNIKFIHLNLEEIESVKEATEELKNLPVDILIHNAGAYKIDRRKTELGFDNIFQINFVSPMFITKELKENIEKRNGKIVAVGSIAHNYSKLNKNDIDFSYNNHCSKVYGNAKRFLMFSLYKLFENNDILSVVHPGITFTGITDHYPKLIFAIIKYPMKIIFMKPKKAALSIIQGIFDNTNNKDWIGPRYFNIWGKPKKSKLKTYNSKEANEILNISEEIYEKFKKTTRKVE